MTANQNAKTAGTRHDGAKTSSAWSYDAIAEVYATDMGQSMPFDDVGWYRELCLQERARSPGCTILELGCGTGRILLDLLKSGLAACGADRSLPMLQRLRGDALVHRLDAQVVQMDIAAPAFCTTRGRFDVILLPYSLITYLRAPQAAESAIATLSELVEAGGCLVLDAFVPQPVTSFGDFRLDYRRPHGTGTLERHKRITACTDGSNRIERRYRVLDADDRAIEEFSTDETIRPYHAEDLVRFGAAAGLHWEALSWDYGAHMDAEGARFATVVLRKPA